MPGPEMSAADRATRLVVANWKMNLTATSAVALARSIAADPVSGARVDILLAPAFVHLAAVGQALRDSPVGLAAQDLHPEDDGAFTGSVSGPMLADLGVGHVLVGHSERRRGCGETDALIARKVTAARRAGLVPLLCVGEDLEERLAGWTLDVVGAQVESSGIAASHEPAIVAYEPVWAIGTGRTASPDQVVDVHAALLARLRPGSRVLYGGSLTPQTAPDLLAHAEVAGFLVGGASLETSSFLAILRLAADAGQT